MSRPSRFHLGAPVREPCGLFPPDAWRAMRTYTAAHPEQTTTPLRQLPALAAQLGVAGLLVKDETLRFGLPSFKALGAGFAIAQLVADGALPPHATLVCASEGNHGRAVAHAATRHGLRARVYVGARVATERADAIAAEGAEVVRVEGTYDEAVRIAARDAARFGWQVISDTGYPGYEDVPRRIMLGYTRLMDECADAWGDTPPDLVIVPGGVGGLAAAVASWYATWGGPQPRLVCVEHLDAACVLASAREGRAVPVAGALATIMGGLRCGEVSHTALPAILERFDAYVAIDDAWVRRAMRRLARPMFHDSPMRVGPCGAAGLGALLALTEDASLRPVRAALGLGPGARVLLIATEGVTEPSLFEAVMAEPPLPGEAILPS